MSQEKTVKKRRISVAAWVLWALALIWTGVIFFLGQQTGAESGALSLKIVRVIYKILPFIGKTEEQAHLFVRKAAHFSAFFLLAGLLQGACNVTFVRRKRSMWAVGLASLLLASANEFEQVFAQGRGPSVWDVLIDFSGAVLGIAIVWLIDRLLRKKKGGGAEQSAIFDAHSKWLCADEFAGLNPVNVFHREGEPYEMDARNKTLGNFHMYARRVFRLGAKAERAEVLVTADDYYKLYINGEFVAQGPAPGYPQAYYVNRIDVVKFLKAGDNVIALDVYYQGLINRVWVSGDLRQGFMCEVRVDGRTVVKSDERFHYMRSSSYETGASYGYSTQWVEHFDSREEPEGWKNVGFDDFLWRACAVKPHADYRLIPQETPVMETAVVAPEEVRREGERVFCDFGREVAGVLLMRAEGEPGSRLIIHTGEELNEDGTVRWQTRCNCLYEDTWTLAGKNCAHEMYDYHAFRYAEIIEEPGARLMELGARVQHYPLDEEACTLDTDDVALMDVFDLCKNTMRAGIQEGYLDCPSREKGQYSGDLAVTSLSHIYISGDTRLLKKALDDWKRSSFIAEGTMAVFPAALMQEIADYALLFPLVALRYYEHTGDRAALQENFEQCRRILAVYGKYAREDGLLDGVTEAWNLVDWPVNLRDGYDFDLSKPIGPGCHNVINAFYVGAVGITEKIAAILGAEEEKRFDKLCQAFDQAFYREETGLYADSVASNHSAQHSNILPLFFGIVPREKEGRVADWLVERGIRTGVYMSFFLLKALARAGRYEDVYRLIVSQGDCSWRNMLKEGATTLFEAWGKEQKNNTSLCHPWASAPVAVLVEDILGITPEVVRGAPWKPQLPARVGRMRMTVPVLGHKVMFVRENGTTMLSMEKTA